MLRTIAVAALLLILCANAVHAEEVPVVAAPRSSPIRASIASTRFDEPYSSLPIAGRRFARQNRAAQKATAGVALRVVGLFAGARLGARIEGNSCHCDDPGLKGALVGAPIGAILGAIAGVKLASR